MSWLLIIWSVCVFSREGRARYLWTWLRGWRSSSAPTWVTSAWEEQSHPKSVCGAASDSQQIRLNTLRNVLVTKDFWGESTKTENFVRSCWVCAAGTSDEGRCGGRDQSEVLHAELLRWDGSKRGSASHQVVSVEGSVSWSRPLRHIWRGCVWVDALKLWISKDQQW